MNRREADLIVIGAGAVGENVADRAVQGGLETVIVEAELVGGECSYWACMPSKALLRSAQVLGAAQAVAGAAKAVTGQIDIPAVLARRDDFTSHWQDEGQVRWLEETGISLIRGRGQITGTREVTVTAADGSITVLTARHAVAVATGSTTSLPEIPGIADVTPWTTRDATSTKSIPASLAVIGGGVVATEMATAFAALGSIVTIIARTGLLTKLEPFAREQVTKALEHRGVRVLCDTTALGMRRDANGVHIETTQGSVSAEQVLLATGRTAATTDLGLESIGLEPGEWLKTDDSLRVKGHDWLYAVGDVNGRALLTHQGKYQARAAGDVIAARATGKPVSDAQWGTHVASADHVAVPHVIFSDPEIATVGLTAAHAREDGRDVRVVDYDLGQVAGASLQRDGYKGSARIVVDERRHTIIGATFVGPDVAELLQAATMAIVADIPIDRLWHVVPAYPTVSEIWLRLLETYGRPGAGASG
ncbi:dihydrolipoyl dehydrogenase family protein [Microbacterium amylolyticum]|uniref:Dihydrolipoamide dehydrogenase n=1 Tax=Microbacterium amylolyticum TaxID=936337 RepID=A0ABS4ZGB7_9MICO|nr:NAD(P)/FAD-dependent oxidoreductase [Microbacterium amylolyticum]MBP2436058.1 dihydrolipoamide dehydrogenase [Microbacterium amylolyticum]